MVSSVSPEEFFTPQEDDLNFPFRKFFSSAE
jgi:hypothetical protein